MFLVISYTITNGGDFLILDAGIKLIEKYLGKDYVHINNCVSNLDEIDFDKYEFIVHVGGPAYIDRLLEKDVYPLVKKIQPLKKKLFMLGCGWFGNIATNKKVYEYKFSEKSKQALDYIEKYGILGCRDYTTVEVLKNNGYQNIIMTGCPVWYDNLEGKMRKEKGITKVIISDMGITKNSKLNKQKYKQVVNVIQLVKKKFKDLEIYFTFNHGINTKYSAEFNKKVAEFLKKEKIKYYELVGSRDLFSVYDDCDFHVGYRVHSHIYCLTRGIPSVLLCEDARGVGMNKTLSFPIIYSNISEKEDEFIDNTYLLSELDYEIDRMIENRKYEIQRITNWFNFCYNTKVNLFFHRLMEEK